MALNCQNNRYQLPVAMYPAHRSSRDSGQAGSSGFSGIKGLVSFLDFMLDLSVTIECFRVSRVDIGPFDPRHIGTGQPQPITGADARELMCSVQPQRTGGCNRWQEENPGNCSTAEEI